MHETYKKPRSVWYSGEVRSKNWNKYADTWMGRGNKGEGLKRVCGSMSIGREGGAERGRRTM